MAMSKGAITHEIADFSGKTDVIVVKASDWEALTVWMKSLPPEALTGRPNFGILPISISSNL